MTLNGYECKTTFWMDISIADRFGINAIKDTYRRAFKAWKNNVEYLTELVMVLNHKIWQHWQEGREGYAEVYDELWQKCAEFAETNLTGDDLAYYFNVTD